MPDPTTDAVRRDPDASYERAREAQATTVEQRAVVSAQIGRPARGDNAVVHRCEFGLPTVVRVGPRLEDGTPFPTVFWLSCPVVCSRVGTLEADGEMVAINERLDSDPTFQAEHAAAYQRAIAFRDTLGDPLPGSPGAGGSERHVKCLHVHVGHHLATGDSPVGGHAFDLLEPVACPGPCVSDEDRAAWEERLETGDPGPIKRSRR